MSRRSLRTDPVQRAEADHQGGYVSEKDFLDLWAPAPVTLGRSAAPFLAYRDAQRPKPVWPYYRRLTQKAEEQLRRVE